MTSCNEFYSVNGELMRGVRDECGRSPGGGGGCDSSMKMPGRLCWGSEKVPILKDQIKRFLCILHTHIMG